MKLLFFSDIHGMPATLGRIFEHAEALKPDGLILLGDVLYHGPRNGVPNAYDPNRVVELLNERREQLIAVRGNCDAEVDQMLLQFPLMSDYSELLTGERRFFLTHGHLWNAFRVPPLPPGSVLAHGHTHCPEIAALENGITLFNPGSVSLPKGGHPRTFGFYDGAQLSVRRLEDGSVYQSGLNA